MSVTNSLSDAGSLTKQYLSALGAVGWLKLGVVVLFVGGSGVTNQLFSLPVDSEMVADSGELIAAAGAAAVGLLIYGAFRYLAAVLEFVFVESLRSKSLSIRLYLRSNLAAGLWLLLFRAALWVGALAVVAVPVGWAILVGDVTVPADVTPIQGVAIGLTALAAVFGLTVSNTLTNAFVVPIMLHERRGPISGWRRFVDAMAANWTGVLAFVLIAWLIGIVLWVVLATVGFVVAFIGLFAFVFGASALTELSSTFEPLVIAAFFVGVVGYQYIISTLIAPIRSYVRYYALVVLGSTEPMLDLIPAQRAAIRSDRSVDDSSPVPTVTIDESTASDESTDQDDSER